MEVLAEFDAPADSPSSAHCIRRWLLSKQNRTQYSSPCHTQQSCSHHTVARHTNSPAALTLPTARTLSPFAHSRCLCHPRHPGENHLPCSREFTMGEKTRGCRVGGGVKWLQFTDFRSEGGNVNCAVYTEHTVYTGVKFCHSGMVV